jgi:hypothetical protein
MCNIISIFKIPLVNDKIKEKHKDAAANEKNYHLFKFLKAHTK